MGFHVSLTGRADLAARVYRQLLDGVLDGRLRPGDRLPPTRELALELRVARNTVSVAYERLAAEGFVEGRVGAGTFVSARAPGQAKLRSAPPGAVRARSVWATIPAGPAVEPPSGPAPIYDFRAGMPDTRLFPIADWRRLVARELRSSAVTSSSYGSAAGHAGLRAAIARHAGVSRSVRAGADDVLVTHGAQQAFDLIARVLIEPGTCVAVEEPGYPPARQLFVTHGARVVSVPVDEEGIDVDAIPKAAGIVYVTPSHQFPLGTAMSPRRRAALLAWAERRGAVVIEDDYDSEFRFEGRPLDPLQSLDRAGRVVYVGSFSKVMLPSLRLGFLVAPASLQPALRAAKRLSDWHGELSTQAALARFIDDGLLARHLRKAQREYSVRRHRVRAALERDFADWLVTVPSAAGLHVAARATAGPAVDLGRVVRRARAAGVVVESLASYAADAAAPEGLVIGYGAIPTARIGEGLRRLAACFRS